MKNTEILQYFLVRDNVIFKSSISGFPIQTPSSPSWEYPAAVSFYCILKRVYDLYHHCIKIAFNRTVFEESMASMWDLSVKYLRWQIPLHVACRLHCWPSNQRLTSVEPKKQHCTRFIIWFWSQDVNWVLFNHRCQIHCKKNALELFFTNM
jgi:hypothetical protein